MDKDQNLTIFIIQLYQSWSIFLDHVSKYTQRYYLARDLELPPQEQNLKSRQVLIKHYKSEEGLLGAIRRDLATLPGELRFICQAQIACGLDAFSTRDEYLDQIIMGFAIRERHGKERRAFYRNQVREQFNLLDTGKSITPQSLNQLEEAFQEHLHPAAKHQAEKTIAKATTQLAE